MERLYRPKNNRVVAGVCGGLAEYFRIDPTIIRIIWVLVSIFSFGTGIVVYFVAWIIMPDEDRVKGAGTGWNEPPKTDTGWNEPPKADTGWNQPPKADADDFAKSFEEEKDNWEQPPKYNSEKNRFVLGAILVGLGVLFLANRVLPALFSLKYLIPILLIVVGGVIVFRRRN